MPSSMSTLRPSASISSALPAFCPVIPRPLPISLRRPSSASTSAGTSSTRDPGPYLRRIVVNLIRSEHRKAKVRALHPIVQPPPSPSHGERVDEWLSLANALRALPPVRRAVVVLRFYEDRTEQQIADLLDRPLNTVKSDLRRALAQLRDALKTKEGERA
jgi:DNA-directed RNA polymerase specialized sigma24 family protein